jgi:hypothetical protein
LPIIQDWFAMPGDTTVVHRLVSATFTADIARTLAGAPRLAVLRDGNESTAFTDFNAAGIGDATLATINSALG